LEDTEDNEVIPGAYILKLCEIQAEIGILGDQFSTFLDHIGTSDEDESQPLWHANITQSIPPKDSQRISSVIFLDSVTDEAASEFYSSELVCDIYRDSIVSIDAYNWGQDRLNQADLPLDQQFSSELTGQGVDVYVIDTGVDPGHIEFDGDRIVRNVWSAFGNGCDPECTDENILDSLDSLSNDGHGHGTHVAGTIGGNTVGIAPNANVYGVKSIGDAGGGTWTNIINGIVWIGENMNGPTVVSMSIGGSFNELSNAALEDLVDAGAVVVVASGNDAADACTRSPGSADSSITVGATTQIDEAASYSNYGSCVSIWAPGTSINSASSGTVSSYSTLSGTSMACPHVAGAVALILESDPTLSVSEVKEVLACLSVAFTENVQNDNWIDSEPRVLLQVPETSTVSCIVSSISSASPVASPTLSPIEDTEATPSFTPTTQPIPIFGTPGRNRGFRLRSQGLSYDVSYSFLYSFSYDD